MEWDGAERLQLVLRDRNKRAIARELGLGASTFASYVAGRRTPDPNTLAKLCRHLGLSADWLLGLSDYQDLGQVLASHKLEMAELVETRAALKATHQRLAELEQLVIRLSEQLVETRRS